MPRTKAHLVANMCFLNEAAFLPEVIPQLQEMCDKVILQDSGSTDDSAEIALSLMREQDSLLSFRQKQPYHLDEMRNNMLVHCDDGDWVLVWDADEIPSGGLKHLKDYLSKHAGNFNVFGVPIFHMRSTTHALNWEYGFCHSRLFLKQDWSHFEGECHAQLVQPVSRAHNLELALGMGVIHWSYFCDKRLKKKEEWYAQQPTSGHGIGTLTKQWQSGLRELPPNMEYEVEDGWLDRIRETE